MVQYVGFGEDRNEFVPLVCLSLSKSRESFSNWNIFDAIYHNLDKYLLYSLFVEYKDEMVTIDSITGLVPFMLVATKYGVSTVYDFLINRPDALILFLLN